MQPDKIYELCSDEELMASYYQSYEYLQKNIFLTCSYIKQRQVQHVFNVLDMTNFSVSMLAGKVKNMAKKAADIAQDFYPEQLGVLMIVNAGMMFTGVFAIVKVWLDEKTR